MIESKALFTFTVSCGIHRLRVIVFPTVKAVHNAYARTYPLDARDVWKDGRQVRGFFYPAKATTKGHAGTIVLPLIGRLNEVIPHEVFHAVINFHGTVNEKDDEAEATAVGVFSAKILEKIKAYRNE